MTTLVDYIHKFSNLGRTAFIYKTGFRTLKYSYADIYKNAMKVAGLLQHHKIGKGDKVLIWAPNSPDWGIFFLGCILNGSVVVPIDIHADKSLLIQIQRQVQARIIFQTRFRPEVLDIETIFAEELEDALADINPGDKREKDEKQKIRKF